MAFTAVGALIAGQAATATLVLAAVTEVGLAMTLVGAVTGNKTLLKVGGVLSMVGGVGGMINGALSGAASGAAAEAGASAGLDAASAEAAGAYGGAAGAEASQIAGIAEMGGEVAGLTGEAGFSSMVDEALTSVAEQGGSLADAGSSVVDDVASDGFGSDAVDVADVADKTTSPQNPEQLIGAPTQTPAPVLDSVNGADVMSDNFAKIKTPSMAGGFGPPSASGNYFGDFMKWVKDNKEVSKFAMDGIKGMVGSDKEDAETDYLNAKTNSMKYGNTVAAYRPLIGVRA